MGGAIWLFVIATVTPAYGNRTGQLSRLPGLRNEDFAVFETSQAGELRRDVPRGPAASPTSPSSRS
jgi:hypothetical protein